jgi:UDP-2,4-diacetamido-2,4,6-trideoxy-beta-L-altropyranose hydrolase
MNVFLRVDSSLSIGSGHIIRCLNLASSLRSLGLNCIFVSKNHNGNIIPKIEINGFETLVINTTVETDDYIRDEKSWLNGGQSDDAECFITLVKQQNCRPDFIIVDHYSLDSEWELLVKKQFPFARLVVVDDLCNRQHYSDVLIDQTFQRDAREYARLNKNNGKILAGTKFALLNPTFSALRELSKAHKAQVKVPSTLLVTMGGVDAQNVTGDVLCCLENGDFPYIDKITVVLGAAYPHQNVIREQIENSKYNVNILTNVNNMAELMSDHDFAIGAMGGTTWERCVMGLPAINVAIADNQLTIAKNLSEIGAIVLHSDDITESTLHNALNQLTTDYHCQRLLAMDICDGLGLARVTQEIVCLPAKDGKNVTLRQATVDDIDFVYQLQCEPKTRQYARDPVIPLYVNHVSWMQKKLKDTKSYFYMIEHDTRCGVIRLDPVEHGNAELEISIFLTDACQGKGIASAAIKRVIMLHNNVSLLATVLPENHASQKLFNSIGLKKISPSEYISEKK